MQQILQRVAIIGAGSMGSAIALGLVDSKIIEASLVTAADPHASKRAPLEARAVRCFEDPSEMLRRAPADCVVLAVKPQVLPGVARSLADVLSDREVISIVAGTDIASLEALLPASRVVRAMPNLPVQVRSGSTAICPSERATDADVELASAIFSALGSARVMREDQLDAEGAVVSCGPAYIALFADCLTRAAVEHGMVAADAREMVLSTIRGVATQLLASGEHPRAYMERVTSPGGTTAAALRELEPSLFCAVEDAVDAALARTHCLAGRRG